MRKMGLALVIVCAAAGAVLVVRQCTAGQCLVAGAVLGAAGLPLLVLARLQLGDAFSVRPVAKGLVTRGLYSRIPHPMYFFLDVALLGLAIALRRPWLVLAWLGLVTAHGWAARRETKVLERAFPDEYPEVQGAGLVVTRPVLRALGAFIRHPAFCTLHFAFRISRRKRRGRT